MTTPLITIDKLNVTYFAGRSNEVKALKNISLEISPGQFIIFFGPSGCGKSTLLYSIAGLERNIEGRITVKGKDLTTMKKLDLEEYHQRVVGMIFQSFYLIASLTVIENVALPQVAIHMSKKERCEGASVLLKKFGVAEQAEKFPTELSGGQQQRVAICRSVVNNPDIVVADEPVGNLDSKSSEDVMNLLRKLNDEQNKTVILVTHDPAHLRHAHKIFFLKDGEIIGTKENTEKEREEPNLALEQESTPALLKKWIQSSPETGKNQAFGSDYIVKAQQILAEILTGMSVDELSSIEANVLHCIQEKKTDKDEIVELLHKSPKKGGIGMNKIHATKLAIEIAGIVEHMIPVEATEDSATTAHKPHVVTLQQEQEIRRYLLDTLDIHLRELSVVETIDAIILQRLRGTIDHHEVQRLLNLPLKEGGAGIDVRIARKFARNLETLSPNFPQKNAHT